MTRRSDCPVSNILDYVGDKWSFLIIRDIALDGKRSYSQFLESDEGIATNILANRLSNLEQAGIISKLPDPSDRRKKIYQLTEQGKDLLPILVEMIVWSAKYDPNTIASPAIVAGAKTDRGALLKHLRARIDQVDNPSV